MMDIEQQRRGRDDDWASDQRDRMSDIAKRATLERLYGDDASAGVDVDVSEPPRDAEGSAEGGLARPGLVGGLALLGIAAVAVVVRRRRSDSSDDDSGGYGGSSDSDDGGRSATVPAANEPTEFDAMADESTGFDTSSDETADVGMEDETGSGSTTEGSGQEYESAEDVPAPDEQPDSERRDEE